MKYFNIFLISFSFLRGGAAIASKKVGLLAQNELGLEVDVLSQDNAGRFQFFKRLISYALSKLQYDSNPIKHSLNFFSYSPIIKEFKNNREQLFHLHWINNDTVGIFDFNKIPAGSLITLHDEWLYCGAEHCYKVDDSSLDFINGYPFFKKGVWGIHWNYLIWKVKFHKLEHRIDLIYTVPSSWMLSRASQSLILRNADVRLLPNPIDVVKFVPSTKVVINEFRSSLGILPDDIVLVFGAIGGKASYLKGAHLLDEALKKLSTQINTDLVKKIKLIDFGGKTKKNDFLQGFQNISLGHVSDQGQLARLYSSADCVVVPSLVESFGQVAAEALACETPVVCFNCSGLTDIVIDGESGLLAKPYSVSDLAEKIKNIVLLDNESRSELGKNGRRQVIEKFSYPVISKQYNRIINDAIKLKSKARH
jgi:glycosyltransferase involved in cell wall biosynthesis